MIGLNQVTTTINVGSKLEKLGFASRMISAKFLKFLSLDSVIPRPYIPPSVPNIKSVQNGAITGANEDAGERGFVANTPLVLLVRGNSVGVKFVNGD